MKTYILDTNVLLHDPNAIHHFEEHNVVIPITVIEEIDHFKRDLSELGRNARTLSRMLDQLRRAGRLSTGVQLKEGGLLRILFDETSVAAVMGKGADNQILEAALNLQNQSGDRCIVVSKDINLRLKADALGLEAEDYETNKQDLSELYQGHHDLTVPPETIMAFREKGELPVIGESRAPNEYVMLQDEGDEANTLLGRLDPEGRVIRKLLQPPASFDGVQARNKEQHYVLDALLDEEVKVVTLAGKAGTGKTLLAVAVGLHNTLRENLYRKMLVCRPTFPMGKDLGYLPGTVEEKLNPWMQPIFDAVDFLSNSFHPPHSKKNGGRDPLIDSNRVAVEPLTYIRGRSIHQQYLVIDESQNLTPLEVKTIITRVGHGTKIILTGDIYQIDNPYVDATSNGLAYIVNRFRPYGLAAHVYLNRGVRSEVAELAANIL